MTENRPISIGIENYKEVINKNYYYIDKTGLIKELLNKGGKVNLFTRPRRFGKTLALSMLKTFFEKDTDISGKVTDNSCYFDGKKIVAEGENYTRHMGQYPVISLSLKSAKQPDFYMAYRMLVDQISDEFKRHRYVLNGDVLLEDERKRYEALMLQKAEQVEYAAALKFLADCLKKYHETNVIILIDEYDVPLENAYFEGFYDQMIKFIRSLFESALETNENLEFAVITGCLRISRESIFTGLNNLEIISILTMDYAEYFGFTETEVQQMLENYGCEQKISKMKEWYNGYLFGRIEIYNPWSVINYVKSVIADNDAFLRPYWSNTSSNSIIRELIEKADTGVKKEIENLIAGGTIEKPVHEEITYGDIHSSQDNLWNFLFFTGYLKAVSQRFDESSNSIYLTMTIPNEEIRYIYQYTIREWLEQKLKVADFTPLYQAILSGDSDTFGTIVKKQLMESISYMDSAENFYHGFLLGLLSALQNYEIVSNRESGDGRPDIMLKPYDETQPAVIMELKRAVKFTQMEGMCVAGLAQIEKKNYERELLEEGYQKILKYGICFCKKSCMVKKA